eukprot:Filipodium_phascolosomae@DN7051_c0_g1_i1.p1
MAVQHGLLDEADNSVDSLSLAISRTASMFGLARAAAKALMFKEAECSVLHNKMNDAVSAAVSLGLLDNSYEGLQCATSRMEAICRYARMTGKALSVKECECRRITKIAKHGSTSTEALHVKEAQCASLQTELTSLQTELDGLRLIKDQEVAALKEEEKETARQNSITIHKLSRKNEELEQLVKGLKSTIMEMAPPTVEKYSQGQLSV